MPNKKLISIKEASQMLGVTPLTLRNWDRNGKLKAMRHPMNNYRVYKAEEIEDLLKDMMDRKPALYVPERKKTRRLEVRHLGE
jgi:excisionase family DNA binding protein